MSQHALSSTDLRHAEGRFKGERGVGIHYQAWVPAGKPKAILVIAHGGFEHAGRYAHVADYMTRVGYWVWACDHRGHGRSAGKRGHIDSFDDYIADLGHIVRIAKEKAPSVKVFLLGHSLGGLIALNYAERRGEELSGLVVTSPGLKGKMKVSAAMVFMASILSRIAPGFSIKVGLDATLISRDREVVQKYVSDPLVHRFVTSRFVTETLRAQEETMLGADKLTVPCLVLQAGDDGLVDPSVTTDFFKRMASADKTLKVYEGFYHEILNEPGKESVLRDIDAWISARI